MATYFRTLTAACIGLLAAASTLAHERTAEAEPDIHTKMAALNVYVQDGMAMILARACNDSIPDFMTGFLPKFTNWRAVNWKQIALGASLSGQFKDAKGAPMDPAVAGNFAAQQLRTLAPELQREECSKLMHFVSSPDSAE